ncbi:MAG: hypothetical protein FJY92_09390, partial [Candidatus Hydrogenedentes bacterium]|nr:hypothetical protein [Candidatus Hydrogenedentota bacterium]
MLSWRRDKKDDAVAQPPVSASAPAPMKPPVAAGQPAPAPGRPRLGELLVHEGVITALQLEEALHKQQETRAFIGQTLVELGYLNQSTLVSFLVKQCKIPHISLLDYNVGEDLFKLVPKAMCQQHRLLPIDKLGKILTLAMVDPLDAAALENVRALCPDLKIKPILCTWNHFEQIARKLFADAAQPAAEVSMGTFGLAPKKSAEKTPAPDDKSQANKAVAELVQEVAPPRSAAAAPPAAPPRPHVQTPAQELPHATLRQPSPEALFDRMGDRVRQALLESVTPLIAEQQKMIAMQIESAKGTPAALAREIASSMRATLLEGIAPLIEAHAHAAAPAVDTHALAKELGESVRAAMLDAVLPALQAAEPQGKGGKQNAAPAFDPRALADHFAAQLDKSLTSFAKEMRGANAEQNDRIAELTDTTKHALLSLREVLDSARAPAPSVDESIATNVAPFPGLRAVDAAHGAASAPHFDPMEEIGLGAEADDRVREALLSGRLQRGFTFDAYLSGAANAFTLSVARAVTEQFSREFTPFYIYGEVGVGKTHLLQAIGNAIAARDPDLRVTYM